MYFFSHIDAFPFESVFSGLDYPCQVLDRLKALMLDSEIVIGANTKIHPSAEIAAPVWIGNNCEIGHAALIRPYTIIGDNCSVGHGSEVKHSILMNGAKVSSLAFVGDSILGNSARVGSGAITANRKFNQTDIKLNGEALGSDFFGVILGDHSRLGANSVTLPGTHIGQYTWVFPMTVASGSVPSRKRVSSNAKMVITDNTPVELK
jgi:bifunctional UDP-N-acetylglucosamine pyrophosphorylase/glucosamine-1-phosphate N-acetyltransferase